jgi:hypothetical protein
MDLKEDVDWIHLAQDRAAVNTYLWKRTAEPFQLAKHDYAPYWCILCSCYAYHGLKFYFINGSLYLPRVYCTILDIGR